MDDRFTPRPIAGWYMIGAVASLLFGLAICALYGVRLATDPSTLAVDERALYDAEPTWVSAAFGLTGLSAALGGIFLLMGKRLAETLLLVALVAVVVWLAGLLLVPQLRDLLMTAEIVMAMVITALTWTIYWFARHSRQRGWLS